MLFKTLYELNSFYNIDTNFLHNSLRKQLKNSSACGLGIIHDGKVYYEVGESVHNNSSNIVNVHTQFPLSSITKVITGLMIEFLVEEGKLSYEEKIGEICPEPILKKLGFAPSITIEMLMSHQSGILNGKVSHYSNVYSKSLGLFVNEDLCKVGYIKSGEGYFYYSDVAINFLGYLCECITNMPFGDLIEKYVLTPLGLNETCFPKNFNRNNVSLGIANFGDQYMDLGYYSDNPSFYPSNQLYSSIHDMSKLLQYFLDNFEKLCRIFTPMTCMSFEQQYCKCWVYERYKEKNIFFHHGADLGVLGRAYIIPSESLGIILLCNSETIGYSNRIIHYLLNKVHINTLKDPVLRHRKKYIKVEKNEVADLAEMYLSISGRARKLSFFKSDTNIVMTFQYMGLDNCETFEVQKNGLDKKYQVIDKTEKTEILYILEERNGIAKVISYKNCFYSAIDSKETEIINRKLFEENVGLYEGILEYQSEKNLCELRLLESGELYAIFQFINVQVFPHPMTYNVFLTNLGILSFEKCGKTVIGFNLKSFLKFTKIA